MTVDILTFCLLKIYDLIAEEVRSHAELSLTNDQLLREIKSCNMINTLLQSVVGDQRVRVLLIVFNLHWML